MLNAIKADYLPCEFFDMKYDLTYYALQNWRIKDDDRKILHRSIENWSVYSPNPCDLCLAHCKERVK